MRFRSHEQIRFVVGTNLDVDNVMIALSDLTSVMGVRVRILNAGFIAFPQGIRNHRSASPHATKHTCSLCFEMFAFLTTTDAKNVNHPPP